MSDHSDFKTIIQSKTFWVNLIALLAFVAQQKWGFVMDEATQAQILGIVNIGLRMITSKPIVWSNK